MMRVVKYSALLPIILLVCNVLVLAQRPGQGGPDQTCAACGSCGACGGSLAFLIIVPIVILVLNVALLVWVARDAKARGMDSAVLWMVLVMLTGVLGLILYIFSRPQGNLIQCQTCGNQRLQASARCPHCGNA
jgi:Phospholipase_D-nuclease N-terminal